MRIILTTLGVGAMAVIIILGATSGSIGAVAWAVRTFETLLVLVAAGVVASSIVTTPSTAVF